MFVILKQALINPIKSLAFFDQFLRSNEMYKYINITPKELKINEDDRCLLLAPHPDDESIGCGGLLLKYPRNFDVACITDGRLGDPGEPVHELVRVRKKEFSTAMKSLNVHAYMFMDVEDSKLLASRRIFKVLDISEYDYIFLPNHLDQHKDHKAVLILLQETIKRSKHKKNLNLAFYEVWSALAITNYYVDISDHVQQKQELIGVYKSQMKIFNYSDRITGLNKYRGLISSVNYAEAFSIFNVEEFLKIS